MFIGTQDIGYLNPRFSIWWKLWLLLKFNIIITNKGDLPFCHERRYSLSHSMGRKF